MIGQGNERLSPSSFPRITFGKLHAIAQKLCVSIQGGGASGNERGRARGAEADESGNPSGIEVRVPYVQDNVLSHETETRQNLSSEHFDTTVK